MKTLALSSAASNNAAIITSKPAAIGSVIVSNAVAAAAFVKFYDKATVPSPGTDVPFLVVQVPASSMQIVPLNFPVRTTTGLGIGMVTGAADTDNTGVALAQLKVVVAYLET